MKKLFLSLTALFFIFACSGKKEDAGATKKSDAKVTVDIFQFKVEAKEALEKAAKEYMAKNPNVTINVQTVGGGSDYGAALKNQFASGKEPTIFNVGGRQEAKDWLNKLEDLSSVNAVTQAFPGTLESVTFDGKVLAMPLNLEGYGLIVNKSILEKAGINVDSLKSYKALEDAIKLLDSKKSELGLDAVIAYPTKETWVTGLHTSNIAIGQEFKNVVEAESIANTIKGSQIRGVKEQIDVAGGEGNLIDVNSTQAAGKIAEEQSKQEILNKNGGYLNNMSDKGTFDGSQVKGKNQALNEIGEKAIIQDSKIKTITSAAGSEAELNALESMKKAGLLDKDTSLYDKKVSDGGNFVAVDKDGNKITMYTDGKGNTLGYEKQTIDKDANDGKGAGVRSIHDENGQILAKTEDAARIKNYQDKEDRSKTTDFTMENKGAAYAGLNQKLSADLANAESEKDPPAAMCGLPGNERQKGAAAYREGPGGGDTAGQHRKEIRIDFPAVQPGHDRRRDTGFRDQLSLRTGSEDTGGVCRFDDRGDRHFRF